MYNYGSADLSHPTVLHPIPVYVGGPNIAPGELVLPVSFTDSYCIELSDRSSSYLQSIHN